MDFRELLTTLCLFQICGSVISIQTYYLSDHCGTTIDIYSEEQIRIKTVRYGSYNNGMSCYVIISSGVTDRMMIYFKGLAIEDDFNCANDWLRIYDGRKSRYPYTPGIIGQDKFCGFSKPSTIYESSDDYITLEFRSDESLAYTGFDIIVTQFHTGYCFSWETKCSNGKCIDDSLACNGYNPCGDESDCNARTVAIIVGATVGSVVFVVLVVSVIVCIVCMRRRSLGRGGYIASGQPTATTVTSANMTTGFGTQYNPPPGYNPNAYGMVHIGQQQYAMPLTTIQPYPKQMTQSSVPATMTSENVTTAVGTQHDSPPGYYETVHNGGRGAQQHS